MGARKVSKLIRLAPRFPLYIFGQGPLVESPRFRGFLLDY
jgi:hypothetical protein